MVRKQFIVFIADDYGNLHDEIVRLCKEERTTNLALDLLEMLERFQDTLSMGTKSEQGRTVVDIVSDRDQYFIEIHMLPTVEIFFRRDHFMGVLVNRESAIAHAFFYANCSSLDEYNNARQTLTEQAKAYSSKCR